MTRSSHEDDVRNALLTADPDGIDWKVESQGPSEHRGPMSWLDAMLSLLTRYEGFYDLLARRMRHHLARATDKLGRVDGQGATTAAMLDVFHELGRERDALIRRGVRALHYERGVPAADVNPQLVGHDWSKSTLTDRGVLVMRVRMWMRREPSTYVELDRRVEVSLPALATTIHVRG